MTDDPSAPPSRRGRRSLGRGPGAVPAGAADDVGVEAEPVSSSTPPLPETGGTPPGPRVGEQEADGAGPDGAKAQDHLGGGSGGADAEPTGTEAEPVPVGEEAAESEAEPRGRGEEAPGRGAEEPGHGAGPPSSGHDAEPPSSVTDQTVGAEPDVLGAGPDGDAEPPIDDGKFKVRLANFEGPFDLLLQLISKHKLDVTEVALSKVTDEFMTYIRRLGSEWDLDQTTEFLVVAATLLDLKAARLLPSAEVEDEGDLALLEARDLLFARLLQYRAYKQIAEIFSGRLDDEARRYPRTVGLEAHHADLLPEVVISIGAEGFAKLAVKAMQPKPKPQVYVEHIHAPLVSVQEQAQIVVARLRESGSASFRELIADTEDTLTVVARFLSLLELYREKAVALDQDEALGELMVRWTGADGDEPLVTDEFDRPPEVPDDKTDSKAGSKEKV
ncbi:segregation and condensation protein A [Streptomyces mesophilus]|uniref:segregation and condensation protein A n=1 Tax=Streptomyces mesophilus TaxID=1775132 RepID=UPI00332293EC